MGNSVLIKIPLYIYVYSEMWMPVAKALKREEFEKRRRTLVKLV